KVGTPGFLAHLRDHKGEYVTVGFVEFLFDTDRLGVDDGAFFYLEVIDIGLVFAAVDGKHIDIGERHVYDKRSGLEFFQKVPILRLVLRASSRICGITKASTSLSGSSSFFLIRIDLE